MKRWPAVFLPAAVLTACVAGIVFVSRDILDFGNGAIVVVMAIGGLGFIEGAARIVHTYAKYHPEKTAQDKVWYSIDDILHKFFVAVTMVVAAAISINVVLYVVDPTPPPPAAPLSLGELLQAIPEADDFAARAGPVIAEFIAENGVVLGPSGERDTFAITTGRGQLFCHIFAPTGPVGAAVLQSPVICDAG